MYTPQEGPNNSPQDQLAPNPGYINGATQDPPAYPGVRNPPPHTQYVYQPPQDPRYFTPISPLLGFSKPRRSAQRRICAAVFVNMFLYLFLIAILFYALNLATVWRVLDFVIGHPGKVDGHIHRCVQGGDGNWTSKGSQHISFDLPLSADALYLLARGSYARGTLEIVPGDFSIPRDTMRVDIDAIYSSPDPFLHTTVCVLERKPGEKGIGIFSPTHPWWFFYEATDFRITVRLPVSFFSPLMISAFEADLPQFRIALPELDLSIHFASLSLYSTNAEIHIGSLGSERADIMTSNAPISGSFRTSSSLTIKTTNSPISVEVTMENGVPNNATVLDLQTTNSILTSAISLMAPGFLSLKHAKYAVKARTTNNQLKLSFPKHGILSDLDLVALTSNGAASVQLHPAYEGTFDLSTSNSAVSVHYDKNAQDPLGLGRRRNQGFDYVTSGRAAGWVNWAGGDVMGSVVVGTTNALNELSLQ